MSVEECAGLKKRGLCYSVVFWKSLWIRYPGFGLRTGRPTNGDCSPISGIKLSSLKSADLFWGPLIVVYKGNRGIFLQDSKRHVHLALLISPPSVEVLRICGDKNEKKNTKNPRKSTIYTVRSENLEVSYLSVSWSRLFFLINKHYYEIQTRRKTENWTTEEEMEGPTPLWGLRNRERT